MPVNNAIAKPCSGAPASNQTLATVASVVPDVIKVRVSVLLIALLIIVAGLSTLFDLTRKSSRTLSPVSYTHLTLPTKA